MPAKVSTVTVYNLQQDVIEQWLIMHYLVLNGRIAEFCSTGLYYVCNISSLAFSWLCVDDHILYKMHID